MVQVNPLAATEGAPQIKQQLIALESSLKAAAQQQGLALTSLAVQYHSGVSNAAPATAPFTPFGSLVPVAAAGAAGGGDADMQEADGGAAVMGIQDALCELKFRVSPTAFYQVRVSVWVCTTCLGWVFAGLLYATGLAKSATCTSTLALLHASDTHALFLSFPHCRKNISTPPHTQVNAGGACMLYHTIGKMAGVGPDSLLLDVCCGTGTIGLTLAKQVREDCMWVLRCMCMMC